MPDKTTIITTTAIICVTSIALFATHHGVDGKLVCAAFLVIGGLGGYHLKDKIAEIIHPAPPQ